MLRRTHELSAHLLGWPDETCEQPVELLPLGLGEPSEELQSMGVDRLLGPRLCLARSSSSFGTSTPFFLELEELRRREEDTPELRAKERTLEQLRWRLAAVARRSASDDLDAAA